MSDLELRRDPDELGFDPVRLARLGEHFTRYVDDGRLAGWLLTVARGGELAYVARAGHADREKGVPVADDTLWRIYSMTKPVTTVAVMMLYEQGLLDLNDPAGRWIEGLREPRVYVGGTAQAPRTVPATEPVRIHHLLSHTAGLTYDFQRRHPVDEMYRNRGFDFGWPKGTDLAGAVEAFTSMPLLFQPGSHFNYSEATTVLGRIVELVSGMSFDRFLRERVLDPLGMHDTDWYAAPEKVERLAQLYVPFDRQAHPFEDLARRATRFPAGLDGGGGLIASAGDYQRFMTMLLRGGELEGVRLLSPRTLELMTSNHLPGGADLTAAAVDSYVEGEYAGIGFGLGFSIVIDQVATQSLATEGTYGWGGAASTLFRIDPFEDLVVAFYTQLLPTGTYPLHRELTTLTYQALVD